MIFYKSILIFYLVICFAESAPPPKHVLEENVRVKIAQTPFRLTKALQSFNEKMFRKLSDLEAGNIVYSPFSLHTALSLLYLGAPTGTNTSHELTALLGLNTLHTEDYLYNYLRVLQTQTDLGDKLNTNVHLANKLFVANSLTLKPVYAAIISNFYNSSVEKVEFENTAETTDRINKFVNDQTNGVIPELFKEQDLNVLSRLVIVNAIYYKGDWLFKFDEEQTEAMEFHVDNERSVEYPFGMKLREPLRMATIEELGADVLELPYKNDFYRMLIILPAQDNDIRSVENRIGLLDVKGIDERLDIQSINSEVDVVLPRFDITYDWSNLADTMKSLGVETIFDAEMANLTNIADEELHVTTITHKSIIKVNEEGTEAAGVSSLVVGTRANGDMTRREFKVDRPFLFYVYDHQNNVPMFVGRVVDPSGSLKLNPVESIVEKSNLDSNCGDLGYDTTGDKDSVSLPCRGEEPFHLRKNIHRVGQK